MKKALAFFTLLLGLISMFAQSGPTFPYQAVVRNSQNQLIKDSTFAVDVEIYQGATLKYSETQSVTTNANGQFTMSIGGGTVGSGTLNDVADWSVAKFKVTCHLSGGDIVSENAVSPVPYALQAANAIGTISGNFLTSDSTVITTMQANIAANANDIAALANRVNTFNTNVCDSVSTCVGNAIDAHNFLTSDSAVITTMQSDIATNTTNITTNATDIATNATNIAANANDIAALANRVNTFNTNVCDSVATCVGNAIDAHNFLTSDSAVITTMQSEIAALQAASLDCNDVKNCIADTLNAYTPTTQLCDAVKDCDFSGNTSIANLLQTLSDQIAAQNRVVDSLAHIVDSLSNITPVTPTGSFTCGTSKVKDAQNNEYNTVKIGNQCWTKENLKTTSSIGATYYPDNQVSNVATYGLLYDWAAAMQVANANTTMITVGDNHQGICPTGWHVPSQAEWETLTKYTFDNYKCDDCEGSWTTGAEVRCIAKALASPLWTGGEANSCYSNTTDNDKNATGFSALPAGIAMLGEAVEFSLTAGFWSTTQYDNSKAYTRGLVYNNTYVSSVDDASKVFAFSVRCLRDAGVGGDEPSTPGEVSCEQVMECMADTLSRLNARITSQGETIAAQGAEIETLNGTVTTQGETIAAQGNTIDSLAHIVDSLSNLTPVNPVTPTDTFNCGTSKVKDVDGNEYNTVQIGNQCWTKENLRTKTHQYGQVWTKTDADSAIYGRYYDWQAAMQIEQGNSTSYTAGDKHRGICPEGWHVPSDAEWTALTDYVKSKSEYQCGGNAANIAKALSQPTGWSNTDTGCNAGNTGDKANATGFSAVPAGGRINGYFGGFGSIAYFWSATQHGASIAWYRGLYSYDSNVGSDDDFKDVGFSVRCLRDAGIGGGGDEPSEPDTPVTPTDTFNCGTDKVSDVDGNEYNTVQIGNQCWTKENLRTTSSIGYTYYPDNQEANVPTYGLLYDWIATMQVSGSIIVGDKHQGICPTGWHVPSSQEWGILTQYTFDNYKCDDCDDSEFGITNDFVPCIAKAWASPLWTGGEANSCDPSTPDSDKNATGFSALPAGAFANEIGGFGYGVVFWSATQYGNNKAYYWGLGSGDDEVVKGRYDKAVALSVRCLRDAGIGGGEPEEGTLPTVTTNSVSNITEATATCGGNVTADGGATVTAHGVCWSTSQNPTTSGSHTTDGSGTGSFTSSITGLTASTTYYVRAYATNSAGTAYGEQRSFTTAAGLCDPYLVGRVASTSSAIDGSDLAETIVEYNTNTDTASLFEFFVRKNNCADCGIKISLEVDMYVVDENSNESLMSNVTDYADLSFASYLDWNYTQWTPADASSISIPGHYESFSGMQQRVNYFNLCYADPDYTCNPISMVSPASMAALPYYGPDYAGVGTPNLGRVHGIKVSSWRQAGTYKFVVRLVRRDDSTAYALTTRDFCTENQLGGHSATLTSLVYDTLTFWVYVDTATNDGQPCPGTPTLTDVDGNTYNTVQIGNQCWMKENMKTTKFADGTVIALGGVNSTTPYRYYPGGEASNVATFGYLYNWTAAMGALSTNEVPSGGQGICPDGWHIPSNAEWYQLTDFLSNSEDYVCGNNSAFIAKSLAATTEWATASSSGCLVGSDLSSNNATGFTALPAGHYSGGYTYFRQNTGFWSSSLKETNVAYKAYLYYNSCQVEHYDSNIQDGCSIRCLKN